jgi:2,3-bisphosphoglycerate-independent phosphoglycerate mutase
MSQLSHRVAARFLAQEQEETASWLFPDPEDARKRLEPLFRKVQEAAEARDADMIGEYMAEIARIYEQHPELESGRLQQASKTPSR